MKNHIITETQLTGRFCSLIFNYFYPKSNKQSFLRKYQLIGNATLVSIGNFDLKLNHLLIIGILYLTFTISFLLRAQPADFGFELNEFDPFFNYRATQYVVDNGITAYFEWNDELSWYPHGRDVSASSQVMLHLNSCNNILDFGGDNGSYMILQLYSLQFLVHYLQ